MVLLSVRHIWVVRLFGHNTYTHTLDLTKVDHSDFYNSCKQILYKKLKKYFGKNYLFCRVDDGFFNRARAGNERKINAYDAKHTLMFLTSEHEDPNTLMNQLEIYWKEYSIILVLRAEYFEQLSLDEYVLLPDVQFEKTIVAAYHVKK